MRRSRPTFSHSHRSAAPRRQLHAPAPAAEFAFDVRRQRLLRCPPECARLLGYTCAELLAMGADFLPRLLHPHSLAQLQAAAPLLPLMAKGRIYRWVCGLRHRDGSPRWLRLHLHTGAGTKYQVVGSLEDVSRHHAAVLALRQETRKMRHLLHVVPTLIYVLELSTGSYLYCGPQAARLLGYSEQELMALGSNVLPMLLEPSHDAAYRAHLAEVATLGNGETRTLEYAVRHRNGHLRWMYGTHTPYGRDATGRVLTIMGAVEDVTGRHAAEEASRKTARSLATQHHLFRQVIDTLPHPVYLKDEKGHYILANNALAAIYGTTPNALVDGTTPPPVSADTARYAAQDQQVMTTGRDLTVEESFTRPDGEVLWLVVTKRLFVQADGTRLVLGVDTGITELKRTQQALEITKAAAEKNVQAKQDFLANMSHEIRTPLHGIIGLTDVLAQTHLNHSQQEHLRLLAGSAEHLLHVLDDVLTTARLGAGKLRPEAIPFAPRELLLSCAALLRPNADEKKLRLHVLAPLAMAQVFGDAHRLRQVLLNLVSNAIKFTETGEVVLRCEVMSSPGNAKPGITWLAFSVADTGIGIARSMLKRVFEPFEQATTSTSRKYGGSGLGLSISRSLVEMMGGTLTVASSLGKGSTFSFVLPCEAHAPAPLPATPAPAAMSKQAAQLNGFAGWALVVEDNPINSLLAETVLRNQGWQVVVAVNGTEAIQQFVIRPFDIVLMDIQMPGMDGETTARALRRHPDPVRAATPIIALTARAQPGEAERLRAGGFAGYLPKPFREHQLIDIIHKTLQPPEA